MRQIPGFPNYSITKVYCDDNAFLYEGQYVIYTGRSAVDSSGLNIPNTKEIRKAESWKDAMESYRNNTFAGVVRKRIQCPGLVEIYAFKETKPIQKSGPIKK